MSPSPSGDMAFARRRPATDSPGGPRSPKGGSTGQATTNPTYSPSY